jgi:hypothetical protein
VTINDIHPWQDLNYLLEGNPRQQAAYHAIQDLRIIQILGQFNPTLVGTLPIGIDIPGSDLDIICEATDLDSLSMLIRSAYDNHKDFNHKFKVINALQSFIATFQYQRFPIQVFAQPLPVEQQNAFRHMLVEARLLEIGGPKAIQEICQLKLCGLKTEPAFARYFHLTGDPYARLLELSLLNNEELINALQNYCFVHFVRFISYRFY